MANLNFTTGYNEAAKAGVAGTILRKVIIGVVVLALVAVGYSIQPLYNTYQTRRIKDTGQEFVKSITAGRHSDVYANMVTQNVRDRQTEAEFAKNLANLESDSPAFALEATSREAKLANYSAKVENLPKTESGRSDGIFNLAMVQQDGKWLVDIVVVQ